MPIRSAPAASRIAPLALLLGALLLAPGVQAEGKKLYRWVDEKGQVHLGDKVPPESAKQGRDTLNQQGLVTGSVPREPTAEDLERQRQEAVQAQQVQQRRDHDRYLIQAFGSVADLQAAREERIASLDGRIALARKASEENEKTLDELRGRVEGKTPDAKLAAQIDSFENALVDNLKLSKRLEAERVETERKYAEDIERFKLLRAGKIKPGD